MQLIRSLILAALCVAVAAQTHCGSDADLYKDEVDCPSEAESNTDGLYYYYKLVVTGAPSSEDSTVVGVKLLSPHNTTITNGLIASDPLYDGGYNMYVSKDCLPQKDGWTIASVEGRQSLKHAEIRIGSGGAGTYYVALLSRAQAGVRPVGSRTVACSVRMFDGLLEKDPATSAMSCSGGLQRLPISEIMDADNPINFCNVRTVSSNFLTARGLLLNDDDDSNTGVILAAVLIPLAIILIALLIFAASHYNKKMKKRARMGKFAALSRGQLGGNPAVGANPDHAPTTTAQEVTL